HSNTCCCPLRRVTPARGGCTVGWGSSMCCATTASSVTTGRSPSSAAAFRWILIVEWRSPLHSFDTPAGVRFLQGDVVTDSLTTDSSLYCHSSDLTIHLGITGERDLRFPLGKLHVL